jgi:hypothetical protein
MNEVRQIKQLQSQLNKMISDAEVFKVMLKNTQREYDHKLASIKKMKEEIAKISEVKALKVSEHAIVRYFERVKGFDIANIEKEILSDSVVGLVEKLGGSGTYPNDEFSVIIKDFTVTTIV